MDYHGIKVIWVYIMPQYLSNMYMLSTNTFYFSRHQSNLWKWHIAEKKTCCILISLIQFPLSNIKPG